MVIILTPLPKVRFYNIGFKFQPETNAQVSHVFPSLCTEALRGVMKNVKIRINFPSVCHCQLFVCLARSKRSET
jgi:hypothetical protein